MLQGAVKHATLVAVAVLISCILGLVAAFKIPVQMIPDLDVRTITVVTQWPGATPQDVEKEILIEQERYLRSLPNLKRMSSYANTGEAEVELEFPFGVDVNEALINVSNALAQVPNYPENVDQPVLYSSSFSSNAFMFFSLKPLTGNPLNIDIDMLRDFAQDNVRPEMERVAGVSQVSVRGGALYQIQILIDQQKLASRNISLVTVRDAIRSRNQDASAGDIDSGKRRYLLRMVGRFQSAEELKELVIAQDQQRTVRLKDVAKVQLDHYELRDVSYNDGERNLMLSVRRESGSNVMDIKDEMTTVVARINRDLLAQNGLQLTLLSDDVRYVKGSVKNVWTNLGIGALLATLVMFWFLKSPRSTLIGVMGVPICTIAAFLGLLIFDRTINVISLAGVAFAIGMTVDNTIVVLENIEQAKQRGLSKLDAAIAGVQEVWPAVLASTMTTVLVFAPILFIVQEAGQLYSDVAIAISGAIIASMLVALLVVPAASARFACTSKKDAAMTQAMRLPKFIPSFLASKTQRIVCVITAVVGLIGGAWLFMPQAEYLPEGEEPKAFSMMIAPPGYNLSHMQKISDELLVYFDQHLNAPSSDFAQGKTDLPSLKYYSLSVGVGSIWFLSEPNDAEHIDAMMAAITAKFKSYPGMRAFSSRGSIISSNDGGTRAVALDISGTEQVDLYRAADAVYRLASEVFDNPQVDSEPSSLTLDQPLIEIEPRWQRLAEVGMTADELGYTVAALSDGAYVDELILDDDKVDVFIFSEAGNKQSLEGLEQAPVVTSQGLLPLNALANLNEKADSDSLRRVDGRRTVTVYIIPPRDVALERAQQLVREQLLPQLQQQGDLLPGVNISIGGAADQLEKTRDALSGNFIVALALCYLLLVAIFKHWGQPLFIMATVPLGMAGGLLGLNIINALGSVFGGFHQPFDMITMLGFLILLGTVVNNPILIVDQSRRNLAAGIEAYQAVISALETRLKPIVMSTMTTLCGLAPLVFIPGEGSELYRGVGIIVLCGIGVSTIVSLTVLPAMLLMVYKHKS